MKQHMKQQKLYIAMSANIAVVLIFSLLLGLSITRSVLLVSTAAQVGTSGYIITTVAGYGSPDVGDNRSAVGAVLNSPLGTRVAPDGSVYIADWLNSRVRRVTPNGIIQTVAGLGTSEARELGNGRPATQAWLRFPRSIDFGSDGSLYIADSNNYMIRRVDPNGIISTVAGSGAPAYSGEGVPASHASFSFPIAVALDISGNINVSDTFSHRIRRVGLNGIIQTIAGTGESGSTGDNGPAIQAQIRQPRDLSIDKTRSLLYFLESPVNYGNPGGSNEIITTIAGNGNASSTGDGGLAVQASVNNPLWCACDQADNVYFHENTPTARIRRIDAVDGIINTYAVIGAVRLWSFAFDSWNNLFYATGPQVFRIDSGTGTKTVIAGTGQLGFSGDGGDALQATFEGAQMIALNQAMEIYLADNGNFRIRKLTPIARTISSRPRIGPRGLVRTISP